MSAAPAKTPPVSDKIKVFVVEDQPKILKNQLKLLDESPEIEIDRHRALGRGGAGRVAAKQAPTCSCSTSACRA